MDRLLAGLQLATPALSLGGVETLVTVPSRTSHRSMSPEERRSTGISDRLVRVSVGIEDVHDLTHDFDQALKANAHGEVEIVLGNGYNAVRPINLATQVI